MYADPIPIWFVWNGWLPICLIFLWIMIKCEIRYSRAAIPHTSTKTQTQTYTHNTNDFTIAAHNRSVFNLFKFVYLFFYFPSTAKLIYVYIQSIDTHTQYIFSFHIFFSALISKQLLYNYYLYYFFTWSNREKKISEINFMATRNECIFFSIWKCYFFIIFGLNSVHIENDILSTKI